jgi:DNA-binding transcriptional regulator LsrR (DeoR family)
MPRRPGRFPEAWAAAAGSGLDPGKLLQATAIARRYFIEQKGKTGIAAEFGISRFQVARILERARRTGLVRISIVVPAPIDAHLSEELRTARRLRHAVVVTTPERPEAALRHQLGTAAGAMVSDLVTPGKTLGVGWGRSLDAMAEAVRLARCDIVQMTGGAGVREISEESVKLVQQLASLSGGRAYPIYAPFVLDTAEAAAALRRQSHVAEAVRKFAHVSVAVTAVGTWDPPNSRLRSSLPGQERRGLERRGVVAELCGMLIDADGKLVETEVTPRCIGIRAEQWRRIPEVVAVAGGRPKRLALQALLAGRWITSLVTDSATAQALIDSRA